MCLLVFQTNFFYTALLYIPLYYDTLEHILFHSYCNYSILFLLIKYKLRSFFLFFPFDFFRLSTDFNFAVFHLLLHALNFLWLNRSILSAKAVFYYIFFFKDKSPFFPFVMYTTCKSYVHLFKGIYFHCSFFFLSISIFVQKDIVLAKAKC